MDEPGFPAACDECSGGWVWRAPWWATPGPEPVVWGYLVHCASGHFAWYAAELDDSERAEARRRLEFGPPATREGAG